MTHVHSTHLQDEKLLLSEGGVVVEHEFAVHAVDVALVVLGHRVDLHQCGVRVEERLVQLKIVE